MGHNKEQPTDYMSTKAFVAGLAGILQVPPETVTADYKLDSGNWDSVAVLATIALIDEQYNITVPAKDLVSCGSVKQLLDLIMARLAAMLQSND